MAFDVITPTRLAVAELTTSMATYRTTPIGSRDIITTVTVANNNATSKQVSIHLVKNGDSADNSNALLPNINVDGNAMLPIRINHVLEENDTIQAQASDTGVTMIISGGNAV